MTSCKPTYFSEISPPNTITLGISFQHHSLGGHSLQLLPNAQVWICSTVLSARSLSFLEVERGASLPCSSPWRRCFQFFTTECVSCGLFIYDLYHVEVISFCSEFVECFYRKRMLNFVRCFFCIHWGDHAVSGLCSVNDVCYID